jgi:chitinase
MTEGAATRRRGPVRRVAGAGLFAGLVGLVGLVAPSPVPSARPAAAATPPVSRAAPYLALGWGNPPDPTAVMAATGVRDVTLAFVLSGKGCSPKWDGTRPLLGGADAASIAAIRAAGGDVSVSFGGWSGRKLGSACKSATALAAAYEAVIGAYGLRAVDVDIEHAEFTNAATRLRVVTALRRVQVDDPSVEITLTFGTTPTGPDAHGRSLLADAASVGLRPFAWTIMPFDFGVPETDMGATSTAAAEGLHADLMAAYGEDSATAYAHMGISSMNGVTDESDETVGVSDYRTILAYATTHHLARVTFWMLDRDRSCPAGTAPGDSCSGITQTPWEFSSLTAGYTG